MYRNSSADSGLPLTVPIMVGRTTDIIPFIIDVMVPTNVITDISILDVCLRRLSSAHSLRAR
jgi:hypothetical protein